MSPDKPIKFNDGNMKIDPAIWIDTDFEYMNLPLNDGSESHIRSAKDPHQKILFVNKPIAVRYNILKNPYYEKIGKTCMQYFFGEKDFALNG